MPTRGCSLWLLLPLSVGVWACGPSSAPPTVRCPEPVSAAPSRSPEPDPGPAPNPAVATSRSGIRLADQFPIASSCEAPLSVTEEVTRLLTRAAAHSTRSQACVDGRGQRVALNDILVCPAPSQGNDRAFEVFYQVATYPEGDTRGCSDDNPCTWLDPTASDHQVTLLLRPTAQDPKRGTLVDLPALPGFVEMTPLDQEHDGKCYGKSAAFTPAEISIGR